MFFLRVALVVFAVCADVVLFCAFFVCAVFFVWLSAVLVLAVAALFGVCFAIFSALFCFVVRRGLWGVVLSAFGLAFVFVVAAVVALLCVCA